MRAASLPSSLVLQAQLAELARARAHLVQGGVAKHWTHLRQVVDPRHGDHAGLSGYVAYSVRGLGPLLLPGPGESVVSGGDCRDGAGHGRAAHRVSDARRVG